MYDDNVKILYTIKFNITLQLHTLTRATKWQYQSGASKYKAKNHERGHKKADLRNIWAEKQ